MLFLAGQIFTQVGNQGTFAAALYHMYLLSGSTLQVSLIGLSRGVAVILFAPLGGYYADRLDRRRLLQLSQSFSMCVSLGLGVLTVAGAARPWHLVLAVIFNGTAQTFDGPTRKALIPAIVPHGQLVRGFAVLNPSGQIGKLAGPALSGLLIAVGGPGLMYLADSVTFIALIVILGLLRIPVVPAADRAVGMFSSILEGARFVRQRSIILHLLALDLSATLFTAFRVVLPALALDTLDVGATGYGVLAAAPAVGAFLGGALAYRLAGTPVASGRIVLGATMGMGVSAIALGQSWSFVSALLAVGSIGLFDSLATVIRQAVVLFEPPDRLRGRVSALYSMSATGGPSFGDLNMGFLAGALGVTAALTVGGIVPIVCVVVATVATRTVRDYRAEPTR